ncbi:CASP-like protein 1C1 [Apium graveolens]|uniref:CASP-like protein 1C1 n=1 Tax=Apium graveolens TaxID=4045 RepID=UPI003D7BD757
MAKRMISILLLRLLALGATISATIVTMTTHDSRNVLNLTFKATYTNAPTLRYFVVANAIASGYSIIVLFIPSKNLLWKFILISDLIVTSMLVSAISAALGVAQVGKKGNAHAGWLPICDQVPKFCDRLTGALIAGFIAPILYLLLVLFSIHNLINLLSVKP